MKEVDRDGEHFVETEGRKKGKFPGKRERR
jgi:hypothetical protein